MLWALIDLLQKSNDLATVGNSG